MVKGGTCMISILTALTTLLVAAEARADPELMEFEGPFGICRIGLPSDHRIQIENTMLSAVGAGGSLSVINLRGGFRTAANLEEYAAAETARFGERVAGWAEISRVGSTVAGFPAISIRSKATFGGRECRLDCHLLLTDLLEVYVGFSCYPEDRDAAATLRQAVLRSLRVGSRSVSRAPRGLKFVKAPTGAFHSAVPSNWKVEEEDGATTAADPTGSAQVTITCRARSGLTLEMLGDAFVEIARASLPEWRQIRREAAPLRGLFGLHIRDAYKAPGDNEITRDTFIFLTHDHQFMLSFGCHEARSGDLRPVLGDILRNLCPGPVPEATPAAGRPQLVEGPGGQFAIWIPAAWTVQKKQDHLVFADPTRQATLICAARPKAHDSLAALVEETLKKDSERFRNIRVESQGPIRIGKAKGAQAVTVVPGATGETLVTYRFALTAEHEHILVFWCNAALRSRYEPTFRHMAATWRIGADAPASPVPVFAPPPSGPAPLVARRDPGGTISFKVPADWQVNPMAGMVMANGPGGKGTLSIFATAQMPYPLEHWAKTLVGQNSRLPGWRLVSQEAATVSGNSAIRITAVRGRGDQSALEITVLVQAGAQQAVYTLLVAKAAHDDAPETYRKMVEGFGFTP